MLRLHTTSHSNEPKACLMVKITTRKHIVDSSIALHPSLSKFLKLWYALYINGLFDVIFQEAPYFHLLTC